MLRWRLILGVVFGSVLALLCWLDAHATLPGVWLLPVALLLAVLGSQEVLGLLSARQLYPSARMLYAGNVAIVLGNFLPVLLGLPAASDWGFWTFALMVLLAFVDEMRRYTQPGGVMQRLALTVFGLSYIGLLLSAVIQLRYLPGTGYGLMPLVSLVVVVKLGDIGAYTVGRLIGKTKMAPVLSPGKTLEGAAGALVFAVAGAYAVLYTAPGFHPVWWVGLVFGVIVGTAGMLGDLAESLFKRDMGQKDSSTWMPGFGGVLDLLDSILYAAPLAYVVWRALLGWDAFTTADPLARLMW